MKTWLVDTGPVVAYLDAEDPAHASVADRWDSFRGQLVTTSAVITEAMHFVSASPSGARHLADLVAASELEVYDLSRPPELHEVGSLMEKYEDTPRTSPMPRSCCSPKRCRFAISSRSIDADSRPIGPGSGMRFASYSTWISNSRRRSLH